MPKIPLPTYRATGTPCTLTRFQIILAFRPMMRRLIVRAALMMLSLWERSMSTELVGVVTPVILPRLYRRRSPIWCVCNLVFAIPLHAARKGYGSGSAAAEATVVGFLYNHSP